MEGHKRYIYIFICKTMFPMSPRPLLSLVTSEKFVALVFNCCGEAKMPGSRGRRTTTKFYTLQNSTISTNRFKRTHSAYILPFFYVCKLQIRIYLFIYNLPLTFKPSFDLSICNLILDDIHGMCAVAVGGQNNHRDMAGLIYCKYCLNKSPDIHNKCK